MVAETTAANTEVASYWLEVDFEKGAERPERIFHAMSGLIEGFSQIDADLAHVVSARIEPVLILEDIQVGSLRSKIGTLLRSIDDEALANLEWRKILGSYLVEGKKKIVSFLDGKGKVGSGTELRELGKELEILASDTDLHRIPAYRPIPQRRLLAGIKTLGDVVSELHERERVAYVVRDRRYVLNPSFSVPPEEVDSILAKEVIESKIEMILKVKKPDYLGNSMWDFRHGEHVFPAKVVDEGWLEKFQRRDVDVGPGDSIRAQVKTEVAYDELGELLSRRHFVVEVLEVIRAPTLEQLRLPRGEGPD